MTVFDEVLNLIDWDNVDSLSEFLGYKPNESETKNIQVLQDEVIIKMRAMTDYELRYWREKLQCNHEAKNQKEYILTIANYLLNDLEGYKEQFYGPYSEKFTEAIDNALESIDIAKTEIE